MPLLRVDVLRSYMPLCTSCPLSRQGLPTVRAYMVVTGILDLELRFRRINGMVWGLLGGRDSHAKFCEINCIGCA
jgi:hypothetical protein